jgi:hypothetical protein
MDITSEQMPFPDDYFDIAVCCQTLEDLTSPTLALQEMSRIARRGVIEVPHRGPESVKHERDSGAFTFGAGHHKWLIEDIDGVLTFTPKIYYMLMEHPIPQWNGPRGVDMNWYGEVPFQINFDIFESHMIENYKKFREDNKEFWQ